MNEIADEHGIHRGQDTQWGRLVLEGLHGLIENGRSIENRDEEELRAGLYQQVGQLDVQGGYPKNYEAVPEAVPVQGGYNTFNNHERLHLKLGRRTPERISQ